MIEKIKMVLVISLFLGCSISVYCQQQEALFSKESYIKNGDTLLYRLMLPSNFYPEKAYPLMLFLHGAGERGGDNTSQLLHGSELFVKNRDSFPAIVIFPQCPKSNYWANAEVDRSTKPLTLKFPLNSAPNASMTLVMGMMDEMASKSYVDKNKIYVGGLSMGGMGTFEILYRKPEMFAAAFAICGAGNPEAASTYARTIPMWIFHGANDDVVNPQSSVDMVGGLLKFGGKPNFSLYAKDNHNSWDSAFAEPELLPWLFSNSKNKQ
ncbi:MAG: prolyl oligopeptidase family serine peptidase [Aquaticitalea sp.]